MLKRAGEEKEEKKSRESEVSLKMCLNESCISCEFCGLFIWPQGRKLREE